MDLIDHLRRVPLFQRLAPYDLQLVADLCQESSLPPGAVLVQQSAPGAWFHIIDSGEATIQRVDERGVRSTVGQLHAGDHFGVTSLLLGEPRDATVRALTEMHLWVLSRLDFAALLETHPLIRRSLLIPADIQTKLRAPHYPWLTTGERVLLHSRRHIIVLARKMVGITALLLLAVALATGRVLAGNAPVSDLWLVGLFALIYAPLALWRWFDWRNDYFAVTTHRITHRERVTFVYESREEIPIDRVQNTNNEVDWLGSLFDYGTLTIATAAPTKLIFHHMPHPERVREVIAQQTLRALATRRAIERQKIRKDLAAALNVRAGEPAAEAGPVQEQALGTMAAPEAPEMRVGVVVRAINALGELGVLPRTRIEKPDSVTWRKHWIFLLRRVAAPFVFGLFLGTVTVIGPLGVVEALLGGVTSGLVSVVVRYYPIGTLILTLVAMAWFWWEASDWANDEYIVTNDRIIDIERHPLAVSTERREANLGMIQNIKTKIPNLTAALLGYGDVTVQTAGTESFTFEKVAHPNDVQREIFRRMDAYREGQRQREATLRREEMGEWFSVHQELTQERTGGVACLRPGGTWDFYAPRDGLSAGEVRAIAITADGSVWFGTNNGVSRLTPRGNWERLSTLDGLVNNDIRALAVGPDGSVWFGTPQGASRLTRHRLWQSFTVAEGLASNLVTALAVGPEGSIWFGSERGASRLTPGGHWQLVSQRDGLIHDSVHAILTATDGSVWFGTSGGASRLTTEGQWETPARAPGQPASPILSMAAAPDGAVWLGSHFGASRCPAGQDQWETVSVREGLAGNVVWAVAVAPEGAVWFGTEAGASRRTPDGVWRTFTRRDGLPNDATKVIALAPDGAVWLG